MKLLIFAITAMAIAAAPPTCNKQKRSGACFKGRLEDRGICGNFTITVLEGDLPGVDATWTNEQTGKTYTQVFRPANPCGIPDNLKPGDSFYFTLDSAGTSNCNRCMAYYPAPGSSISIRVQEGSCN